MLEVHRNVSARASERAHKDLCAMQHRGRELRQESFRSRAASRLCMGRAVRRAYGDSGDVVASSAQRGSRPAPPHPLECGCAPSPPPVGPPPSRRAAQRPGSPPRSRSKARPSAKTSGLGREVATASHASQGGFATLERRRGIRQGIGPLLGDLEARKQGAEPTAERPRHASERGMRTQRPSGRGWSGGENDLRRAGAGPERALEGVWKDPGELERVK